MIKTSVSTSPSISDSFSVSRKESICFCISTISSNCFSMEAKATAIIIAVGSIGIVRFSVVETVSTSANFPIFDSLVAPQKKPPFACFNPFPASLRSL